MVILFLSLALSLSLSHIHKSFTFQKIEKWKARDELQFLSKKLHTSEL
jgi:hypothetical protein